MAAGALTFAAEATRLTCPRTDALSCPCQPRILSYVRDSSTLLLAIAMTQRVEINLFFEQGLYLILFTSNAGGL
jgi:hypothetical protein